MPAIDFDGPNKIIEIGYDAPTTVVRVVDIYSRWKEWIQAGNAQYDEAFAESVGGNDLGAGVSLDGYFFIRNDLGWRIRPNDTDHVLVVDGQLFGYSTSTAVYLSRPARTIQIKETLSSRSQVVNPAADTVTASGSYQGRVWLDPNAARSDTEFPTGTSVQPVNNMTAAVQIANTYGLKEIYILDDITLTENVSGYIITGPDKGSVITVDTSANVLNTVFDGLDVTGYFDGPARIRNSTVDHIIDGFVGEIDWCHLNTGIVCIGDVNLFGCSSAVPGDGSPYFDFDGGQYQSQIRHYNGSIEIRNMVAGAKLSVDFVSGRLKIHSSCTGGEIKLRGTGEPFEDSSGGAVTVDSDGFMYPARAAEDIVPHVWAAD